MTMTEANRGTQMPKQLLRPWLLLLLGKSSDYGYALAERLRSFGADIDDPSMVYSALRRMERAGLVTSAIDLPSRGPSRRMYRLTPTGIEARAEWAACLDGMQAWVHRGAPAANASASPSNFEPKAPDTYPQSPKSKLSS